MDISKAAPYRAFFCGFFMPIRSRIFLKKTMKEEQSEVFRFSMLFAFQGFSVRSTSIDQLNSAKK